MQFHVLVHCVDEDDRAAKIKQLLASIRITGDLLHRSGPDKPLLIKRPFSEAQAVSLRDQLLRLGFESSVLPRNKLRKSKSAHPQSTAGKPDAPGSPGISRLNQQIQALFRVPAEGVAQICFKPLASSLLALRILAKPVVDIFLLVLACLLPPLASGWLMLALSDVAFLLGLLIFPVFLVITISCSALLAFFLWPRQAQPRPRLKLNTNRDPRLQLFIAHVSHLVSSPAPTTVWLTMKGRPRLSVEKGKASVSLELPLPLVCALSLAELASLLAGEAARFRGSQLSPPLRFVERRGVSLRRYASSMLDLSKLERAQNELRSAALVRLLRQAGATLSAAEQWRVTCAHRHLRRMDKLLANSEASRRMRDLFWGGPAQELEDKIDQFNLYLENQSQYADSEPDGWLVDRLGAAVTQQHGATTAPPQGAIVQGNISTRVLLNDLQQYDQALSRLFYELQGFDLRYLQLLSPEEITRQRQLNDKLRHMANQYFADWHQPRQFWQIAVQARLPGLSTANIVQQLNRCIGQLRRLAPERSELLARQERLKQQVAELRAARKVNTSGGSFKLVYAPAAALGLLPSQEALEARLRECYEELFHQNSIMGERLNLGLLLAQHRGMETSAIGETLSCLGRTRPKLEQWHLELSELRLLNASANQGRAVNVRLSVHQKELSRSIAAGYQYLVRQLQRCPYHFCNPAIASLGELLELRLQQRRPHHSIAKVELLLTVIDEAHEKISHRAAGIAAQIEHHYGIEKIKRLEPAAS